MHACYSFVNHLIASSIIIVFYYLQSDSGIEFTFQLIDMYNKLKKAKQDIEIVYVSFDENEEEWRAYCQLMPWVSLPFEDTCIENLQKIFNISDSGKES